MKNNPNSWWARNSKSLPIKSSSCQFWTDARMAGAENCSTNCWRSLFSKKKSVCGRSNEHFPNASMARAQLDEINLHVKTEPWQPFVFKAKKAACAKTTARSFATETCTFFRQSTVSTATDANRAASKEPWRHSWWIRRIHRAAADPLRWDWRITSKCPMAWLF